MDILVAQMRHGGRMWPLFLHPHDGLWSRQRRKGLEMAARRYNLRGFSSVQTGTDPFLGQVVEALRAHPQADAVIVEHPHTLPLLSAAAPLVGRSLGQDLLPASFFANSAMEIMCPGCLMLDVLHEGRLARRLLELMTSIVQGQCNQRAEIWPYKIAASSVS
jgi:hypothetical protein